MNIYGGGGVCIFFLKKRKFRSKSKRLSRKRAYREVSEIESQDQNITTITKQEGNIGVKKRGRESSFLKRRGERAQEGEKKDTSIPFSVEDEKENDIGSLGSSLFMKET